MKFTLSAALSGALVPLAAAFPFKLVEKMQNDPELQARSLDILNEKRQPGADAATGLFEAVPTFDAAKQYIDIGRGSGHEWQAPGPHDLRGPCPGLNAFANHGFLPRNGYATIQQYIEVTEQVVGMGNDLAEFLAALGAVIDSGDLMAWSIGGTPPPGIGGLAAQNGNGLSGSHNKYENDVSPTRPDLYESGNNYITSADQFQDMIDASPGGVVTLDSLGTYRAQRFARQKAQNPYFFNGPFTGTVVQPAAFTFIYRFMANHSAEDPIGTLTYDVLQNWFGIQGENGAYTAPFGWESIPDNWYKRSLTAPYTIEYLLGDILSVAALHPELLDIGGNLDGKGNNFAGVDLRDLTGGVYNSGDLLRGNNLGCFGFQSVAQEKGDLLSAPVLTQLQDLLGSVVSQLGCPRLERIDKKELEQFPGYMRAPAYKNKARKREVVNGELH
ncbi:Aromatic peroxygenase [Lecanosticta acicola]|uniref:Aromatic peroxygenase n=1 Tax=Lecanosticta acicola TaxID=111012 RepID=A0AAI8Z1H1_9PEZI|nr:Aromatic peroxygenase [Lecanosticta acicola]